MKKKFFETRSKAQMAIKEGNVFAYNDLAINFYKNKGYHTIMLVDIKKI